MNIFKLEQSGLKYFTVRNISEILNIPENSARVFGSRYVKKGIFVRIKKNFYLLKNQIRNLNTENLMQISNLLQTPSYISLMTALSYFEATTQIYREVIEAISPVRTEEFSTKNLEFVYKKIKSDLYFGYNRINNIFMAEKEKALLDLIYFSTLKRYSFDASSIDLSQFSKNKLAELSQKFPTKTKQALKLLFNKK